MATNPRVHDSEASTTVPIVAGATLAAGKMGWFGNYFGRITNAAVSGDTVALEIAGVFKLPKTSGSSTAMAQGLEVGWDSTNEKVVAGTFGGRIGRVFEAAVDGDTTVLVRLEPGPRQFRTKYTASAGDDSGNSLTIDTGFGATPTGTITAQIENVSGVFRNPQGAKSWGSGANLGKLTFADSGLAVNEIMHVRVDFQ